MSTSTAELAIMASTTYDAIKSTDSEDDTLPYATHVLMGQEFDGDTPTSLDVLYAVMTDNWPVLRKASVPFDPYGDGGESTDPEEAAGYRSTFYSLVAPTILTDREARHVATTLSTAADRYIHGLAEKPPKGAIVILGMLAIYDRTAHELSEITVGPDSITETFEPIETVGAQILAPQDFINTMLEPDIPINLDTAPDPVKRALSNIGLRCIFEALRPEDDTHPMIQSAFIA